MPGRSENYLFTLYRYIEMNPVKMIVYGLTLETYATLINYCITAKESVSRFLAFSNRNDGVNGDLPVEKFLIRIKKKDDTPNRQVLYALGKPPQRKDKTLSYQ